MKPVSEFVANLDAVFERFGRIEAKRMFGGYGIYHDGHMFALVSDDVLYLKADPQSVAWFVELDLPPFKYPRDGRQLTLSYHAAPAEIFDDPEQAKRWADRAYAAARRARRRKQDPPRGK